MSMKYEKFENYLCVSEKTKCIEIHMRDFIHIFVMLTNLHINNIDKIDLAKYLSLQKLSTAQN